MPFQGRRKNPLEHFRQVLFQNVYARLRRSSGSGHPPHQGLEILPVALQQFRRAVHRMHNQVGRFGISKTAACSGPGELVADRRQQSRQAAGQLCAGLELTLGDDPHLADALQHLLQIRLLGRRHFCVMADQRHPLAHFGDQGRHDPGKRPARHPLHARHLDPAGDGDQVGLIRQRAADLRQRRVHLACSDA